MNSGSEARLFEKAGLLPVWSPDTPWPDVSFIPNTECSATVGSPATQRRAHGKTCTVILEAAPGRR